MKAAVRYPAARSTVESVAVDSARRKLSLFRMPWR